MTAEQTSNAAEHAAPPDERSGSYVVVARRYRPQTFVELIGQEHVARALTGAIASNRVGHAYLFTGARGVGKTSAARILAKALDCQQGPTASPCNQCDVCQSISAGSDVDVLEIDGASNRGIDEIRALRQNVNIRPSRARYKIYIIDEVHMLTKEAFNALLKTLEEPPEHVKFIFCTTEANKIPITILSRCQRFDFAGIQLPSIVERLSQIVAAEGVTAEPVALEMLARRAGGSMRDSQSLLEQLLALGNQQITEAEVHAMLGTAGAVRLAELVAHLTNHDAAAAIADLDAALTEGVDVGQLLEQLLGYFRDLMISAVGCPPSTLLHAAVGEHAQMAEAGRQLGLATVLAIMQVLDQTLSRLRYTTQSRTLAEMALVRIAQLDDLDALSDVIAELRGMPPAALSATSPASTGAARTGTAPTGPRPTVHSTLPVETLPEGAKKKAGVNGAAVEPAPVIAAHAPEELAPAELTEAMAMPLWQQALATLEGLVTTNAGLCESVSVSGPGRLVARFRAKYTSCKTFCERLDQLSQLEGALSQAAGGAVKLEFALLPDEPKATPERRAVPNRQRLAETAEHPLVRKAVELFDAQLTRVVPPNEPG